MTARLIMYTTTFCGPCQRLKIQLGEANIDFDEVNIETDEAAAAWVKSINSGNRTVPTLRFADDTTMTNPSLAQVTAKLNAAN